MLLHVDMQRLRLVDCLCTSALEQHLEHVYSATSPYRPPGPVWDLKWGEVWLSSRLG